MRADHARGDRGIGFGVDENERAGDAVLGVSVERDGPQQVERDHADVVHLQRCGGLMLQRAQVDAVIDGGDRWRARCGWRA